MTNCRLLFCFIFLSSGLFAVDFNPCYQKNSRSIYEIDGINCVGISQNKLLCHDPEDKIKDFKVICPFCDAVCVGELPSYEKIKDLSEEELNPIATIEPIKKERSN